MIYIIFDKSIINMSICTRLATLLLLTSFIQANAQTPIPRLTNRSKQGILAYFKTIVKNGQVIIGQQCSQSTDVALEYKKNLCPLFLIFQVKQADTKPWI
jgi:hypothetical protein